MKVKIGNKVTLWNGKVGSVLEVIENKANILFEDGSRKFANLNDIISSSEVKAESNELDKAKETLHAFKVSKKRVKAGTDSVAYKLAFINFVDQVAQAIEMDDSGSLDSISFMQQELTDYIPSLLKEYDINIPTEELETLGKEIENKINEKWAGKLTVQELENEFSDSVYQLGLAYVGHGVAPSDNSNIDMFLDERGVSDHGLNGNADRISYLAYNIVDELKDNIVNTKTETLKVRKASAKKVGYIDYEVDGNSYTIDYVAIIYTSDEHLADEVVIEGIDDMPEEVFEEKEEDIKERILDKIYIELENKQASVSKVASSLAKDLADYLMNNFPNYKPYPVMISAFKDKVELDAKDAEWLVTYVSANGFGQGGKGYNWVLKQIEKMLSEKGLTAKNSKVIAAKEYVLWGIPEGQEDETLLLERVQGELITSKEDAEKFKKILEDRFKAKKVRIQELDLSQPLNWDAKKLLSNKKQFFKVAIETKDAAIDMSWEGKLADTIKEVADKVFHKLYGSSRQNVTIAFKPMDNEKFKNDNNSEIKVLDFEEAVPEGWETYITPNSFVAMEKNEMFREIQEVFRTLPILKEQKDGKVNVPVVAKKLIFKSENLSIYKVNSKEIVKVHSDFKGVGFNKKNTYIPNDELWVDENVDVSEALMEKSLMDNHDMAEKDAKELAYAVKKASFPSENLNAKYSVGTILVQEGKDTSDFIEVLGLTEDSYILRRRAIGEVSKEKDNPTYDIRYEEKITTVDKDKTLSKFARKVISKQALDEKKLTLDAASSDGSLVQLRLVGNTNIFTGVPEKDADAPDMWVLYRDNESQANGEAPVTPLFSLDMIEGDIEKISNHGEIEIESKLKAISSKVTALEETEKEDKDYEVFMVSVLVDNPKEETVARAIKKYKDVSTYLGYYVYTPEVGKPLVSVYFTKDTTLDSLPVSEEDKEFSGKDTLYSSDIENLKEFNKELLEKEGSIRVAMAPESYPEMDHWLETKTAYYIKQLLKAYNKGGYPVMIPMLMKEPELHTWDADELEKYLKEKEFPVWAKYNLEDNYFASKKIANDDSEILEVKVYGEPYFIKKIDSTHVYMSWNKEKLESSMPLHVAQLPSKELSDDVYKWLNTGNKEDIKSEYKIASKIKGSKKKIAGTELWQRNDGKYWLLSTVTMEPVSDSFFDTKEEAVDFGIKNNRWIPDIRERLLSEDVDGKGSPEDFKFGSKKASLTKKDKELLNENKNNIKQVDAGLWEYKGNNIFLYDGGAEVAGEQTKEWVVVLGELSTGKTIGTFTNLKDAIELLKQSDTEAFENKYYAKKANSSLKVGDKVIPNEKAKILADKMPSSHLAASVQDFADTGDPTGSMVVTNIKGNLVYVAREGLGEEHSIAIDAKYLEKYELAADAYASKKASMAYSMTDANNEPEYYNDLDYPAFVNAYLVSTQYGGPEEGGWWWTAYDLLDSVKVSSEEESQTVVKELWRKYVDMNDPAKLSDVNSEGKVRIYTEKEQGEQETKHAPTYSSLKIAGIQKKAARLGNYDFDIHGGEKWVMEESEDGRKIVSKK